MAFPYQMNLALSRSQAAVLAPITYVAQGTPVDLTTANAQLTFTNVATGLVDLTLGVGTGLTLGGPAGTIQVSLTALQAAQLAGDQYEYALQLDMG